MAKTSAGKLTRHFRAWVRENKYRLWGAQRKFAKACGVSTATASLWLNGKADIGHDRLPQVAEVLGVEVSDLTLKGGR